MDVIWEAVAEAELRRILAETRAHLETALSYDWRPTSPDVSPLIAERDRGRVREWMAGCGVK